MLTTTFQHRRQFFFGGGELRLSRIFRLIFGERRKYGGGG